MALTADKLRDYYDGTIECLPVKASSKIYKGSAVGEDGAGYARALVAGDKFLGFALEEADNSNGAAGDITVKVRTKGAVSLPVTGLAITDNDGVPVFASDDATFVKTGAGNSFIGYVRRYESAGVGVVEFDAHAIPPMASQAPANATFSIGAEAGDTIVASIQLKDALGNDLAVRGAVTAYLASDATGDTLEPASATLAVTAGTDGVLIELATDNAFQLISEVDGDIDVSINQTAADTHYLILVMPDGRLVASPAITFA